jgi:hypothetical protein
MTLRKTLLSLTFGTLLSLSACNQDRKVDRERLIYTGTVQNYHVKIEQTKKAGLLETRNISLDAISSNTVPHQVSGLDYGSNGELENIYLMRTKDSGLFTIKITGERHEVIPYFNFADTNVQVQEVKSVKELIQRAVSEVYMEKNRLK